MKSIKSNILPIVLLFAATAVGAEDIIIEKDGVQLSTAEVDSFLLTIPENDRKLFSGNKQRMIEVIDNLIVNKVSYQRALANDIDENPEVKAKIEQATQRIIVEAWIEQYIADQPEANYRAIAQEKYILNKDNYVSQETVDVKHILIAANNRSAEQAHEMANQVLQEIKSGNMAFDAAAQQHTEDPTYRNNKGLISAVRRGATAPEFEQAAFALTPEAPLSEVVNTPFGSHIIYLVAKNEAQPLDFADVETQLIEEAKQSYRSTIINNYLDRIRSQEVNVNQDVLNSYLDSYRTDHS